MASSQLDPVDEKIRERLLAMGAPIPADQPARLHFARITVRHPLEKQLIAVEEFLLALAKAGGNQVHLAERTLTSPRQIRHQVSRARKLGVDVNGRVEAMMREHKITPWVPVPPPRPAPGPRGPRRTSSSKPARKTTKRKPVKKVAKRGTSARRPA